MHADDSRMILKANGGSCLLKELLQIVGATGTIGTRDLQRHFPVRYRIVGQIDDGEAATTQLTFHDEAIDVRGKWYLRFALQFRVALAGTMVRGGSRRNGHVSRQTEPLIDEGHMIGKTLAIRLPIGHLLVLVERCEFQGEQIEKQG